MTRTLAVVVSCAALAMTACSSSSSTTATPKASASASGSASGGLTDAQLDGRKATFPVVKALQLQDSDVAAIGQKGTLTDLSLDFAIPADDTSDAFCGLTPTVSPTPRVSPAGTVPFAQQEVDFRPSGASDVLFYANVIQYPTVKEAADYLAMAIGDSARCQAGTHTGSDGSTYDLTLTGRQVSAGSLPVSANAVFDANSRVLTPEPGAATYYRQVYQQQGRYLTYLQYSRPTPLSQGDLDAVTTLATLLGKRLLTAPTS